MPQDNLRPSTSQSARREGVRRTGASTWRFVTEPLSSLDSVGSSSLSSSTGVTPSPSISNGQRLSLVGLGSQSGSRVFKDSILSPRTDRPSKPLKAVGATTSDERLQAFKKHRHARPLPPSTMQALSGSSGPLSLGEGTPQQQTKPLPSWLEKAEVAPLSWDAIHKSTSTEAVPDIPVPPPLPEGEDSQESSRLVTFALPGRKARGEVKINADASLEESTKGSSALRQQRPPMTPRIPRSPRTPAEPMKSSLSDSVVSQVASEHSPPKQGSSTSTTASDAAKSRRRSRSRSMATVTALEGTMDVLRRNLAVALDEMKVEFGFTEPGQIKRLEGILEVLDCAHYGGIYAVHHPTQRVGESLVAHPPPPAAIDAQAPPTAASGSLVAVRPDPDAVLPTALTVKRPSQRRVADPTWSVADEGSPARRNTTLDSGDAGSVARDRSDKRDERLVMEESFAHPKNLKQIFVGSADEEIARKKAHRRSTRSTRSKSDAYARSLEQRPLSEFRVDECDGGVQKALPTLAGSLEQLKILDSDV